MKRALFRIHRFIYLAWVLILFSLLYPVLWFLSRDKVRYYSLLVRLRKWIALSSTFLAGFYFKVEGRDSIDRSKKYIICANHSSNLDISAIIAAFPNEFSFLGKDELLDNPVTALFFKTIDIPVNRASKMSSFRAFKSAKSLLEQGKSIAIFPEGGIDDQFPPQLISFKNGAFKLAMDLNVSVLPIIIHDAWKLCWDDGSKYGTTPGVCRISILSPIDPHDYVSEVELRDVVFDAFRTILHPEACKSLQE